MSYKIHGRIYIADLREAVLQNKAWVIKPKFAKCGVKCNFTFVCSVRDLG